MRSNIENDEHILCFDGAENIICTWCANESINDHNSPEGGLDERDLPVSTHHNSGSVEYCDQCSEEIKGTDEGE